MSKRIAALLAARSVRSARRGAVTLLAIILLTAVTSWPASPAAAKAGGDRLSAGEWLNANQYLVSQNGQYVLRMQGDGNLVIYAPGNAPLWSTNTGGRSPSGAWFINQGDGNLVVYTVATPHVALWSKPGPGPAGTLIMQDDGNLVLYRNDGKGPTWASGTNAGSTANLANQIRGSNRIALATAHVSGVRDSATAQQNIIDTANGQTAARSCYQTAPCGRVALDGRMLRGLLTLSDTYSFQVSEIAGGSHSSGSRHYAGVAFDVSVINGRGVSASHPAYRAFMQRCRDLGATEVLGPGNSGHATHIHCAWSRP